jgi:hypothetical protein
MRTRTTTVRRGRSTIFAVRSRCCAVPWSGWRLSVPATIMRPTTPRRWASWPRISLRPQRVDALVKSPALSLPPEEIGRQITAAGFDARREDHRLFAAAKQGMDDVAAKLGRQLRSHIEAGEQRRRLWQVGAACLVTGVILWAVLAGPIARSLPASWLMPERIAARSLRMPMWEGGQRLMRAGDAAAFAGMLTANRLATANRDMLAACRRRAAKTEKAVRCMIEIQAGRPDIASADPKTVMIDPRRHDNLPAVINES